MSLLRHDRRLAVVNGVVVEPLAAGDVQQRLRIRRPDRRVLLVVEIGDLLRRAAFRIGDPDFVTARSIRHERDVLAIGRPLRELAARRHAIRIDARDVAALGRDGQDLSARRDRRAPARGRDVERVDFIADRAELDLVVLVVGADVDLDLVAAAARDVELPDAEVVFVDDGLAVARHRRPEQAAVGVLGHLHRLARPSRESCRCCSRSRALRGCRASRSSRSAADRPT